MPEDAAVPLEYDDQVWRHLMEAACAALLHDVAGWAIVWKSSGPEKIWMKDVPRWWRAVPHTLLWVRVEQGERSWQQMAAFGDEERGWPIDRFVQEMVVPLIARLRWHLEHDQREETSYAGPTVGHCPLDTAAG